jgi:hypothetical protein
MMDVIVTVLSMVKRMDAVLSTREDRQDPPFGLFSNTHQQ